MKKAFDFITGDRKNFELAYMKLYGKQDHTAEIEKIKRSILKKYLCLAVIMPVLIVGSVVYRSFTDVSWINADIGNEITIVRPPDGENALRIPLKLEALWGDEEKLASNVVLIINPEELEGSAEHEDKGEESGKINIEAELRKLVKIINKSSDGESITLPAEIPGGIKLVWKEQSSSNIPIILPIFLLSVFIIYKNRYSRIKTLESEAKESIVRELPEFINKLILLLNAGLVITSAFERILESYAGREKEVRSYFYSQLLAVNREVRETNSPMIGGLKDFAGRSGVREFMRVANIISDNIDKGAGLVEKLQAEAELLWLTKKKLAEEKGKIAETKLTFPLVVLLLVLIMVTTAPALMEM